MAICTLTEATSTEVGFCKKRPKGLKYKVKKENKDKLKIFLNEQLGSRSEK